MPASSRLHWDAPANPLLARLALKRAAGETIFDLTESNPTRAALDLHPDLPALLAQPAASVYDPSPRGLPSARAAVADYYRARGADVSPDSICLTASTSEAYSFLFKLLCDAGDEILVPQPSYPLLDFLAALDSVRPVNYRLDYDDALGWRINFDYLHAVLSPRTRAIVAVHPNNPTGSYLTQSEIEQLDAVCARNDLALIVDEVFLDYGRGPAPGGGRTLAGGAGRGSARFVLSGLSKIAAAPQLKLGWIQINDRQGARGDAASKLDFIADTYLSVSTPAQLAAPALLARCGEIQQQIKDRLDGNESWLHDHCPPHCRILAREGGWYAVLDFDDGLSDDARALALLERHNVFIHPGYFFDFRRDGVVVLSLLTPEEVFREGAARLLTAERGKA